MSCEVCNGTGEVELLTTVAECSRCNSGAWYSIDGPVEWEYRRRWFRDSFAFRIEAPSSYDFTTRVDDDRMELYAEESPLVVLRHRGDFTDLSAAPKAEGIASEPHERCDIPERYLREYVTTGQLTLRMEPYHEFSMKVEVGKDATVDWTPSVVCIGGELVVWCPCLDDSLDDMDTLEER